MFNQDTRVEVKEKLILLYVFHTLNMPITATQVDDIILGLELIDFFPLQQYKTDLIQNGMIESNELDDETYLMLTEQGINALNFFRNRLSQSDTIRIDQEVERVKKDVKRARLIKAEYFKLDDNDYMVDMQIKEGSYDLIRLTLNVPSNKTAKAMCDKWKEDAVEMYGQVIALFDI